MLKELDFTGERVIPGKTPNVLYQEHISRYTFASQFTNNKTVLDVACGTGYGDWQMLKKGNAKKIMGIDISKEAINYAIDRYKDEKISFVRADAVDLPVSDGYFDVVVSFETIEHLEEPRRFLSECKRVLKNGGLFICSSPNKKIYSPYSKKPLNPFHVMEFYPEQFFTLLNEYFSHVDLYGQCNINLFKKTVFRYGRKLFSIIPNGDNVKNKIKNLMLSRKSLAGENDIESQGENSEETIDGNCKVSKFINNQITTPTYIIAVARKNEKEI